jgi:hypothetical protein
MSQQVTMSQHVTAGHRMSQHDSLSHPEAPVQTKSPRSLASLTFPLSVCLSSHVALGLQQLSGAARQDSSDDGALTPRRQDKTAVARGMSMRRTSNNATRRLSTAIAGLVPSSDSLVSRNMSGLPKDLRIWQTGYPLPMR